MSTPQTSDSGDEPEHRHDGRTSWSVERTTHHDQFVTFSVADAAFAVPMAPVQEIIRVPEVASLPLAPPALDGLANLRGRVLPIVNLRRLLGIAQQDHDDATRALVTHLGQPLGFVVDRVASVVSVQPHELEPATGVQSVVQADYVTGVIKRKASEGEQQLLLVLDFQRLIEEHFGRLSGAASILASGAKPATGHELGEQAAGPAAAEAVEPAGTGELRLVSFTVSKQEYAIDIAEVQEIVQMPANVTVVPRTAPHVLGLISLRQRLLPLVSLRSLLNLPDLQRHEHDRIVVVALPGGSQVGLVTDAVKEVLSVPRQQAESMPELLGHHGELSSICRLEDGHRLVSIITTSRLLQLDAIADALQAAHAAAGAPQDDSSETTMTQVEGALLDDYMQVVIFRLGAEEFGVPIMSVQEIVRLPDVLTRVPRTPAFVEGVINLRGTVLPVIDQRSRLGLERIDRNDRQRIMVYTLGGQRTGFIVDSVAEVLHIPRQQIELAPDLSDEQHQLISRVARLDGGRRLVMLINPTHLLAARDAQALSELLVTKPGQPVSVPTTSDGAGESRLARAA